MKKFKQKKLIGIFFVIILLIFGIGGKVYMNKNTTEKNKTEKEYQQGVKIIQDYVTDYLVKNYEGIEKIEWQGVGVEYRNSPIYGDSLFGNYVDTDAKIFVSKDKYFTINFLLTDETDYDNDLDKYVKLESLNPENIDSNVSMEIRNSKKDFKKEADKIEFDRLKKSSIGSPDAKIKDNLELHELKY